MNLSRNAVWTAALVLCVFSQAARAEDENPLKSAKVGDWAEFKMKTMGQEMPMKFTVKAKTDTEVTLEVEVMGQKQEQKVDLTKAYDGMNSANLPPGTKIEKLGEGAEKVKVGDKEVDAKWTEFKAVIVNQGQEIPSQMKIWISKDIPAVAMAKMHIVTEAMGQKVEMDLECSGYGNGK